MPGGGEQDEGVEVARGQPPLADELHRHEQRERRADADDDGEEEPVAVGAQHVLEGGRVAVAGPGRQPPRRPRPPSPSTPMPASTPRLPSRSSRSTIITANAVQDDHDRGQRRLPVGREGGDVDGRHPTR